MCASLGRRYRIALLHGKMNTQEKDAVMERFLHREVDILVSTTVIEVGVDVKAANIMVIYDAHRFDSHRFISCVPGRKRNASGILLSVKQHEGSGFPAAVENLRTDKRQLCDSPCGSAA